MHAMQKCNTAIHNTLLSLSLGIKNLLKNIVPVGFPSEMINRVVIPYSDEVLPSLRSCFSVSGTLVRLFMLFTVLKTFLRSWHLARISER